MMLIHFENIQQKVITIRDTPVMLDSDVAILYKLETKRINEAVKNNPQRFPYRYIIELNKNVFENLKSKFSTSSWGGPSKNQTNRQMIAAGFSSSKMQIKLISQINS